MNRKNVGIFLLWLGLLVFFLYSSQYIIDLESITNPRRQEALGRVLKALLRPNIFERGEQGTLVFSNTSYYAVEKMWETLLTAFLATFLSALFATLLTFLTARPSSWWGRDLNILLQPILSIIRSLHPLLTVIIFIVYAGLGAFAGVLALTLFSTAVLVEKFSAYAQEHMTLSWKELLKVRFSGLAFRHFPVNMTIATVLGFMGGGGIGSILQQNINRLNYRDAGVAILVIIIVIGNVDLIRRAVWHRIRQAD